MTMDSNLKETLEKIYTDYHKPDFMKLDPVEYVHNFKDERNIEAVGLLASSLAYGKVEIIRSNIEKIISITGNDPADFIVSTSFTRKKKLLSGFKHRFNNGTDIALLFECVKLAFAESGSLKGIFLDNLDKNDSNIKRPLNEFVKKIREYAEKIAGKPESSFLQLFPMPQDGSACKRLNMYLRWMVRKKDGIDFGIWNCVGAEKLVMPVDTHVATIARSLELTKRNSVNWLMAEDITETLKKISPLDPVKYDFSLCRTGMVGFRNKQNLN
jgi:uncharacterized protein (TIGR02757 family)